MSTAVDWQAVARDRLHPTKVEVLELLAEVGRASPTQMFYDHGAGDGLTLPGFAYHVRALRDAGLIVEVDRVMRRCTIEHIYVLATKARQP